MLLANRLNSSSVQGSSCLRHAAPPAAPCRSIVKPASIKQHVSHRQHCGTALRAVKEDESAVEEEEQESYDPQPTTGEVESFLSTLVSTNVGEINLQVGSFSLYAKRSTGGVSVSAPQTVVIKEAAPPPPPMDPIKSMDESVDESLVYVSSPKVGIFTRGKYVAGKRVGKGNVANKGDQIKKGQPLGYVEQLGTYVPVEAPQAGEVVTFLVDEGAPVEYQQIVVEMAPFFGGHIIGDSKYA